MIYLINQYSMKNLILLIILLSFGEMSFSQMFQNDIDKKYLDPFIIHSKRDSLKINEVSLSLIGGLNFTRPTYGIEDVQEGDWRYHFRLGCHYQFHKNGVINFNMVYEKLSHSETITKNFNGNTYQGENIYTYELVGLESLLGWCSNRAVVNYYFEFGPGVFTLISNSRTQTIPLASKYRIFYNSTLLLTSNIGSGLTINPRDGDFGINFSINYRFCLTGARYDWTSTGAPGMAENKFQFFDFGLGLKYKL